MSHLWGRAGLMAALLTLIGVLGITVVIATTGPAPAGPGVCHKQVALAFTTDEDMHAAVDRLRHYPGVDGVYGADRYETHIMLLRAYRETPELGALVAKYDNVRAVAWVRSDRSGLYDLRDQLRVTIARVDAAYVEAPCTPGEAPGVPDQWGRLAPGIGSTPEDK